MRIMMNEIGTCETEKNDVVQEGCLQNDPQCRGAAGLQPASLAINFD